MKDRAPSRRAILVSVFIFVLVWGFFLGPIRGLRGILAAGLIVLTFFLLGIWLTSSHILPIQQERGQRWETLKTLLRFAFGWPTLMAVVREARVLPARDGTSREGESGRGVIDVDSGSVVALVTDTELSRIEGPGIIFTREHEKIGRVVDLRTQSRSKEVELITRDGIHVRVSVGVKFRIDQVRARSVQNLPSKWPQPYWWRDHAVKLALWEEGIESGKPVSWDEIALRTAVSHLRTIVAEYTFDGLSEPQNLMANPRQDIQKRLDARVREAVANRGIEVLGVSVGFFFPQDFPLDFFDPPPLELGQAAQGKKAKTPPKEIGKISQLRLNSWRARWQSHVIKIRAEAKAESDRQHELARSQAQRELIERVMQALKGSTVSGTRIADEIMQRFLDRLQKIQAESSSRKRLSEEVRALLQLPSDRTDQTSWRDDREPGSR